MLNDTPLIILWLGALRRATIGDEPQCCISRLHLHRGFPAQADRHQHVKRKIGWRMLYGVVGLIHCGAQVSMRARWINAVH